MELREESKGILDIVAKAVRNGERLDDETLSNAEMFIKMLRLPPLPIPYTVEKFLQEYQPGQVLHLRKHQNPEVEYWTVITRISQDNAMGLTKYGSVSLGGFDKSFSFKDLTSFDIERNGEWVRWSCK